MKSWLLIAVIAAGAGYLLLHQPFAVHTTQQPLVTSLGLHYASHASKDFYPTLVADSTSPSLPDTVYGGIVSHHLYAEEHIAKFFLSMRSQKPSTVVIIGPNHFTAGVHDIQVSRYDYETPWGQLNSNKDVISSLVNRAGAFEEETSFEHEHSVSALVTFVKYAFPNATLVPIIIKRGTPMASMEQLAQVLNDTLPADAVVIASVDFSHHGNRFMAQFHDDKSVATIESFDFENIPKLEIDSPPSIYALLKYLGLRGAQETVSVRTDSSIIGNNPTSEDVTSYMFAHFFKGPIRAKPTLSTLHFGDIMVDRSVRPRVAQGMNPFELIKGVEGNFFRGMDWVLANLEGPISTTPDCQKKEIVFEFPPSTAQLLKSNGISIVNLANNHGYDCKTTGLADTKGYLGEAGVDYFGTIAGGADIVTKTIQGKTITFLGAELINPTPDRLTSFLGQISKARKTSDYVIVHAHWGDEYKKLPNADQQRMGHQIIDAGADVLIGHHPHVVETAEIYKGKVIFYSLGNFVFDQYMPGTKEGIGVGVIQQDHATRFYVYPFDIINYQPKLKPYAQAIETCDFVLKDITKRDGCFFELPR